MDTNRLPWDYDLLGEVMVRLKDKGLPKMELKGRYVGQSVSPGVSVLDYLKPLDIEGVLEGRGEMFFLKKRLSL